MNIRTNKGYFFKRILTSWSINFLIFPRKTITYIGTYSTYINLSFLEIIDILSIILTIKLRNKSINI